MLDGEAGIIIHCEIETDFQFDIKLINFWWKAKKSCPYLSLDYLRIKLFKIRPSLSLENLTYVIIW